MTDCTTVGVLGRRRRWFRRAGVGLALAMGMALALAMGTVAGLASTPAAVGATAPTIVVRGDGIGAARFGQRQAIATVDLRTALGPPRHSVTLRANQHCTIDAALQWPSLTAYFAHHRFVGLSTVAVNGQFLPPSNLSTARGLRVGDTLAHARQLYGRALRTSLAQGGTWFAATAHGTVDGILTAEPNQPAQVPRIGSIDGGDVGCPAVSP